MKMYDFTTISAQEFDKITKKHPLGSMFQDPRWAKVKSDNWQAKFVALKFNNRITVASLILVRSLPLGFAMWYLPRGPLFDRKKPEELQKFSSELKKLARKEHCLLVKADPNIIINSSSFSEARANFNATRDTKLVELFKTVGWRHFGFNKAMKDTIQPRFNARLYFDDDEPVERKFTKKIRQQIRKWHNLGVTTQEINLKQIDDLVAVMESTAEAKQISLRDSAYFKRLKKSFGDDCLLTITSIDPQDYLAKIQTNYDELTKNQTDIGAQKQRQIDSAKKLLDEAKRLAKKYKKPINLSASVSILVNQELNMLYAGMDRNFRQFYATHVTNLWRLNWAREQGANCANFSGIEGTLNDSLSEFKEAFGTSVDEYIGEFNLYTYPVLSWLFDKVLPTAKKLFLKLRRH
ncbi:MAG: peptidoglycan bridge formation glycyltransferase FemA/FemB family protein [Candidatus Nanosyncoccaceae bacterium]|jgi:serine/alanine adding enzyme